MEPRCSWKNLGSCQGEIDWSYRGITIGSLQVDDCGSTLENLLLKSSSIIFECISALISIITIQYYSPYALSNHSRKILCDHSTMPIKKYSKSPAWGSYKPQPTSNGAFWLSIPTTSLKDSCRPGRSCSKMDDSNKGPVWIFDSYTLYTHISNYQYVSNKWIIIANKC